MSQGPPRTFSYSPIANNRQQPQQPFISSPTTLNSMNGSNRGNGSNSGGGSTTTSTGSTQETLYCDSCQTFRHVSFFNERDFKYNVCNICHTREIQKRKHQLERYEIYEEQQRTLKQARYQSIQYQPTQQQSQPKSSSNNNNAPITLGSTPPQTISSPQVKPSPPPPTSSVMLTSSHQNNMFATPSTPMRNQSQLQSHMHSLQPTITLPPPSPPQQETSVHNLILPSNPIIDSPTPSAKSSPATIEKDTIDLDQFVKELEKETEFDRKQYHLDIEFLMESMGDNAGFTQLGRGICEKVLEGTGFNFSLKDRRRSTKSPDTLSTLRYYCSQRSDTAKPRKAESPKAQNRYDCAGALTIIIDLLKKTAHVTVIHKHQHPPFVSQHHHQQQQKKAQQNVQQQQQQQLPSQYMKQHVDRQYDVLRQKVLEIGLLLEGQQRFGNAEFLQTATDALSTADEMLTACKAYESSSSNTPSNKYTLHYNKTGQQ